jgi:hypothetical protein
MSSETTFKFDDVTATKFLMHPTPCLAAAPTGLGSKNNKGKKRAAGVPAASVATAVSFGDEEGGAPPGQVLQ